jgi:hypothetical protein
MGFEPTISAGERPKTYALDRATSGTGLKDVYWTQMSQDKIQDTIMNIEIKIDCYKKRVNNFNG